MTTDGLKPHSFDVALRSTADTPYGAAHPVQAAPLVPSKIESNYAAECERRKQFLIALIAKLEASEITLSEIYEEPLSWQLIENLNRIDRLDVVLDAAKKELVRVNEAAMFAQCNDEESLRRTREAVQRRVAAERLPEIKQLLVDLNLFDRVEHFDYDVNSQVNGHKGRLILQVALSTEAAPYNNPVKPYIIHVMLEVGDRGMKHLIPRRAVTFELLKQALADFAAGYRAATL